MKNDKPSGEIVLQIPYPGGRETPIAWREVVIAPPVVAQLHFSQQHPRATLLYLRLLSQRPTMWRDRTHLLLPSAERLWQLASEWELCGVEVTLLHPSFMAWGGMDQAWCEEVVGRALEAEPGWQPLLTATLARLHCASAEGLPPPVEAALRVLWETEAWRTEVRRWLAYDLLQWPCLPPLNARRFIQRQMRGVTAAEIQAEWEWLEQQGVLTIASEGEGLVITLDPLRLQPRRRPPGETR